MNDDKVNSFLTHADEFAKPSDDMVDNVSVDTDNWTENETVTSDHTKTLNKIIIFTPVHTFFL